MSEPTPLETLTKAVEGLTFPSETDAPFTPFFWEEASDSAPTKEIVAAHSNKEAGDITSKSLAALFKPLVQEEEWHNEAEKAEVRRYAELQETLKATLKQIKVFRIGEVEIDVYIVGTTSGGYAGLQTKAVET
jgi:hypothetical protein